MTRDQLQFIHLFQNPIKMQFGFGYRKHRYCTNPKIFVSNFSELLPVFSITDKYKEIIALLDAGVTMFGIGLI